MKQADVLIVGGGIAGMTAALELVDGGCSVILIDSEPYIGGRVASLGTVFPSMVEGSSLVAPLFGRIEKEVCGERLEVWPLTTVGSVKGTLGAFDVTVLTKARHVSDLCTKCGECSEACPVIVPDDMELGLSEPKAIRVVRKGWPVGTYVDMRFCTRCGKCLDACSRDAIDLDEKDTSETIGVGAIVLATGLEAIDPSMIPEFGFGRSKDIITSVQLERLLSKNGPTQGRPLRPSDKTEPKTIVFVQCVGSRVERRGVRYCSNVCCLNAIKNSTIIKERCPGSDVYVLYIDIRAHGRGYEEAYKEARKKGVMFIRGQASLVQVRDGRPVVSGENTLLKELYEIPADLVVLCVGLRTSDLSRSAIRSTGADLNEEGLIVVSDELAKPDRSIAPGIFVAGSLESPKDIKDAILHARACAGSVTHGLEAARSRTV